MVQQGEKILSLLTFKNRKIEQDVQNVPENGFVTEPNREQGRTFSFKSGLKSLSKNQASDKNSPFNRLQNQSIQQTQIISGYFVKEKSYKEMVISRINNFLCGVLALLVMVCLVSYYFVINGEIQLNQIRKETLALNYDNEDMQNRLDILQSFSNVDRQVAKTKILQTAKQVMELSAANVPNVELENKNVSHAPGWSMGY